jgi:hypothetical protein
MIGPGPGGSTGPGVTDPQCPRLGNRARTCPRYAPRKPRPCTRRAKQPGPRVPRAGALRFRAGPGSPSAPVDTARAPGPAGGREPYPRQARSEATEASPLRLAYTEEPQPERAQ